jgi:hypothetical protein
VRFEWYQIECGSGNIDRDIVVVKYIFKNGKIHNVVFAVIVVGCEKYMQGQEEWQWIDEKCTVG